MLGIIFGAAGMLLVYYTAQAIYDPVDRDFHIGYYTGIGATLLCVLVNTIL